jgi:hypothetical protein
LPFFFPLFVKFLISFISPFPLCFIFLFHVHPLSQRAIILCDVTFPLCRLYSCTFLMFVSYSVRVHSCYLCGLLYDLPRFLWCGWESIAIPYWFACHIPVFLLGYTFFCAYYLPMNNNLDSQISENGN